MDGCVSVCVWLFSRLFASLIALVDELLLISQKNEEQEFFVIVRLLFILSCVCYMCSRYLNK